VELLGTGPCQACHGASYEGGRIGVACADCHPSYPHGEGYLGAAHRDDVLQLGEAVCLGCHEGGAGFAADFTCASTCHGGG
jgi:hypothetical protein